MKVQTISGLIPVLPAVGLPARAVEAAEQARQAVRAPARQPGRRPAGRSGSAASAEIGDERTVLLSVIDPDELRHTLAEFFDEAAFLSPHGLRAVSKRYENNPYTLEGIPGAWIDYEPAESTTTHVRRQLELARPDLDAAQLPRDPPVRHLPALLRRRLQARVPDRLGPAAHVRRDRAGPRRPAHLDLAAGPRRPPARSTATPSGSRPTRPGRTTSSSTSTSTATTAPASARRTRPAGRRSSPT